MRLRAVSCDVLARPVYLCAARSPHAVDVSLLRRGLHNDPPNLRARLQAEIDAVGPEYDAVVLAYGLCGGATAGLRAAQVPLVVPRAHDCITIFLGSRERYAQEFGAHPGTYWYVGDHIARDDQSGDALLGAGSGSDGAFQATYADYVAKYGEDNADYLMETLGAWRSHYDRAAFIAMEVVSDDSAAAQALDEAQRRGWRFERLAGDLRIVRRLMDGDWADDFLVLQPGELLAMSYDEDVVRAVGPDAG
jgi:Protein of unknown function (DUF1638)